MRISFKEPVAPRYIHVNHKTNLVHLLVPIVGGQDISTDNTCQTTAALKDFFDNGALRALTAYREALITDIKRLPENHSECESKEFRLAQIEIYIEAVRDMQYNYSAAIEACLAKPSNLYSIQLRPCVPDPISRVVNPAFTIKREIDGLGIPLSPLYNAMHRFFSSITIPTQDPLARLTNAVTNSLSRAAQFEDIQQALDKHCFALFGLSIDFKKFADGTVATKEAIDTLMAFDEHATASEYIMALLGACAPNMEESLPAHPFYSISSSTPTHRRAELLSITTQFFLAHLTIYCKARDISHKNFGEILDASPVLSRNLVSTVFTALSTGDSVERVLCAFCNVHAHLFELARSLKSDDIARVIKKFELTWRTITGTKENPHMDDFMILDLEARGEKAKFMTHQGAICTNFAEIVDVVAASVNPRYFADIRKDFATHPAEIPHKNEFIAKYVDIEAEEATECLPPPACGFGISM